MTQTPPLPPRELIVSFVYTNDGGGNAMFGDISRSYMGTARLTPESEAVIRRVLQTAYEAGQIMDVYVGPAATLSLGFVSLLASLRDCLGEETVNASI